MKNYFSDNLKYLREKYKLSQNKLGEMSGVNQTTIARWETEEMSPTIDNLVDLSKALNVSLPELVGKDLRLNNSEILNEIIIHEDKETGMKVTIANIEWDSLSKEEQENYINQAMDSFYEYKKTLKDKK